MDVFEYGPQPRRVVLGAGKDARAVGRERDSCDGIRVSGEARHDLAAGRVPQARHNVAGAGEYARAVGRERD